MLRVCSNGHLTGYRKCTTCGSDKSARLGDRRTPVYLTHEDMKDLRQLRAETRLATRASYYAPSRGRSGPLVGGLGGVGLALGR